MIVIYGIASMDSMTNFGWTQLIAATNEVHSEFIMQFIDEEGHQNLCQVFILLWASKVSFPNLWALFLKLH